MLISPGNHSNPYNGPRAFRIGEQIYGRQRETSQLANLLIAERIVLLHSPSGAGKTSLIQAALIPRLAKRKFRLLPIVRLNLNLPEGLSGENQTNRYIYSALLSLEADLPLEQRLPRERLAQISLLDYLAQRPANENGPDIEVLIFDQFEEILTLDSIDLQAKREFFEQLGQALSVPTRWALFAMREDFVAALDPYVLPVPSRFSNRFRLDLLDKEAALQAIQQPARHAGVEFEDSAAGKLVDDLRRVRVQRPDGELEPQLGPYVEPVQLQVVCYRLWDVPRPDPDQITAQDLVALGEVDQSLVDQSLSEYYAQQVAATAAQTRVSERAIRNWFDHQLISEQGLRGTVLMGPESSGELDNQAIRSLIDAHLVRAEKRGGATWFELAHDRLINPVRSDNAAWLAANLSLLQQQAILWDHQGRPERLLLRAKDFEQADQWGTLHQDELLPYEEAFLEACRSLNERERHARRRSRLIRILGVIVLVLAVLSLVLVYISGQARLDAQASSLEAQLSQVSKLVSISNSNLEMSPSRSLLLSVEAVNAASQPGLSHLPAAEEALRTAIAEPRGRALPGHQDWVWSLAFSPDGRRLATTGKDNNVLLWNLEAPNPAQNPQILEGHTDWIYHLAFSPDGRWLATASKDGTARLWDLQAPDPQASSLELRGHQGEVYTLAFSPDGRWLATASKDSKIYLWDLTAPDPAADPQVLAGHTNWVIALAFSPDGHLLASGSVDFDVRVWDLRSADPGAGSLILSGHSDYVKALAFSPDGHWLASGSDDSTARLWDLTSQDPAAGSQILAGHKAPINALAFSPDGHWLATGSGGRALSELDNTVRLWDLTAPEPAANPRVLYGHEELITSLAFSPDAHWLASGSYDHTIRLWDLEAANLQAKPRVLYGHEDWVFSLAFSPDGRWLASGGADGMVRLWDMQVENATIDPAVLAGHTDWVKTLAFSPDGRLATGSFDHTIRLWQVDPPGLQAVLANDDWTWTLAFSPDGRWLASGSKDGTVHLWDMDSPDPATGAQVFVGHQDLVSSLAFSPDGHWLASGSFDHTIRLWDLSAADPGANPLVLNGHLDQVNALAFGPGGRWLASASSDGTIRLWSMQSANPASPIATLSDHQAAVNVLAFSSDGRWLASGSADGTARLWDLGAENIGANPTNLLGHTDEITSLAFSPDDRWLATGSLDWTARLWDLQAADPSSSSRLLSGHVNAIHTLAFSLQGKWLATGSNDATINLWQLEKDGPVSEPVVLRGHQREVYALAFSPDEHWLASGSTDGTTRLWDLDLDELIALACQNAGRNLSQEEWQAYFPGKDYHQTCTQWPPGQ
jgi:WD40 repeat protein